MKNIFRLFVIVALTAIFTVSCTKDNTAPSTNTEQTTLDFQKAIIGSWQFAEKGIEVAMHDGHICTDPQNMPAGKITYIVHWAKVVSDENRAFKPNGEYNSYQKSILTCKGVYKISDNGLLESHTNCDDDVAKIEGITPTSLTVRQGTNYFRYQKLD